MRHWFTGEADVKVTTSNVNGINGRLRSASLERLPSDLLRPPVLDRLGLSTGRECLRRHPNGNRAPRRLDFDNTSCAISWHRSTRARSCVSPAFRLCLEQVDDKSGRQAKLLR